MTTTRSSMDSTNDQPLQGLLVLDFSQFLSGPLATLRLADLGARVIKVERPGQGDLGRTLYLSDTDINGENTLFHAINRDKESLAADLKNPRDIEKLRRLIARADVMVQNFRPGVIERLRLDYETVAQSNPRHRLRINQRLWRCGGVARPTRPGSAGAGAIGNYVVERRRRRSTDSILTGNCGHAYGTQSLPGNPCLPGAARGHGTRRACGGQPAGILD